MDGIIIVDSDTIYYRIQSEVHVDVDVYVQVVRQHRHTRDQESISAPACLACLWKKWSIAFYQTIRSGLECKAYHCATVDRIGLAEGQYSKVPTSTLSVKPSAHQERAILAKFTFVTIFM